MSDDMSDEMPESVATQIERGRLFLQQIGLDNLAITGLAELQVHLGDLASDGDTAFNDTFFDRVELQLNEDNIPRVIPVLLEPLVDVLKRTKRDPAPCLSLIEKLLRPLTFHQVLELTDMDTILMALLSPHPGSQHLALAVLHKAALTPLDASYLGFNHGVFQELVRCWISAEDADVAGKAARVLGDVLRTNFRGYPDAPTNGHSPEPGYGGLWKFMFRTREIASLIPRYCVHSIERTKSQATISQGRLLRMLPRLASLDMFFMTRTPYPDLFPVPAEVSDLTGVLTWAAISMIDDDDYLMHLSLLDFLETLVSVMRVAGNRSPQVDNTMARIIRAAVSDNQRLLNELRDLPKRTIEEEAEPLREYLNILLP